MKHPFLRLTAFSLILAAPTLTALAQTATGGSGGGGNPGIILRAQGDERAVNVKEELAALRAANAKLIGSVRRAPVNFADAIARVRARANAIGGAKALAPALKKLPNQESVTLRLLAIREMAKGRMTGMLLLLLAAFDRAPDSPDALADLAGVLAGMGYANEAIACLDELARRNTVPTPPMGIRGESVLAYVRGYCLVRLGDVAAARPLLAGVVAREPMLAEAARLLAIIGGGAAEDRKNFLLGVWRHRSELMVCAGVDLDKDEPDPLKKGDNVAIDIRSLVDLEKGKPGKLPEVPYGRSVLDANGLAPVLEDAMRAADLRFGDLLSQRKTPKGFLHTEDDVIETWGHRMARVVHTLDYRDRQLRDLDRQRRLAAGDAVKELREIEVRRNKSAEEALEALARDFIAKKAPGPNVAQMGEVQRPFFEAALQQARQVAVRQEIAERKWFAEWHLIATAIAAQIGDPAWHEFVRLSIEAQRSQSHHRLLHIAAMQVRAGEHPFVTKEAGETPLKPVPEPVEKCNADNSISFSTSHSITDDVLPFDVGVELNCEGLTAEVDIETEVPGVSVSTEFGVDTKGDFTAFVGPKASVDIGDKKVTALSGSAKGGIYVTGSRNGIKDVGVKYEIKGSAKIGVASAARKFDEGKLSFVPAAASGDDSAMGPVSVGPSR